MHMSPETFGTLFKKLRLQVGISTLKELGDLLEKQGFSYEASIFSHWQTGSKIPIQRKIILALIKIFREKNQYITIEEYNRLLVSAKHGYLTEHEISDLKIPHSFSPFLAPPKISYFTGREKEIAKIFQILSSNKIVQISGQAGMGKTALAIEVVHRYMSFFPDGILWYRVDTTNVGSILNHIAKMYGEDIDALEDIQLKSSFISSLLKDKKILFILDNVEQKNIKDLHFLLIPRDTIRYVFTTQHSFFRIDPSPYVFKLTSFTQEDLQNLYKKVVSNKNSSHFIFFCKNYGSLPLVSASIARQIKYLRTNHMYSNLEYILSSSTDLLTYEDKNLYDYLNKVKTILSSNERKLWISTATFNAVDFSEEAIQYINGLSSNESKQTLEKLFSLSLIEKSNNNRWRVHPTTKSYLSSFLDKTEYYSLISYYIDTFRREENGYNNMYPKIEKDFDEIKSLLEYCLKNNSLDHAIQLWEFFSVYLWERGYWYMLKTFGEQLVKLADKKGENVMSATIMLRELLWLYIWQGESLKAYKYLNNKPLVETIKEDKFLLGTRQQQMGFIFSQHKELQKALTHLNSAKIIFEELSNPLNCAETIMYIGNAYEKSEDLTEALIWYKKSFDLARKYNYIEIESKSHYYIGEVYKKLGDFDKAKEHFVAALLIDNTVKRRAGIGWNKHSLSEIAKAEGEIEVANKLHREAHEAFSLVGVNPSLH